MLYNKSFGAGNPLYLLHGWALNSRVWDPILDRLQQHWRVITVDLPGHGKSPPLAAPDYTIDAITDEIATVMEQGARVVGWSLGGMVALNLACRYPHLVKQLVLVASSPQFACSDDWPCAVDNSVINSFASDLHKDYRATILRFLAIQTLGSEQAKPVIRELREKVFINGEPHIDTLSKGLQLLISTNLRTVAAKVQCPTLIVLGEKDTMAPASSGEHTQQLIAGSNVKIIPGAGHAPFISHSEEFIKSVMEFLKE